MWCRGARPLSESIGRTESNRVCQGAQNSRVVVDDRHVDDLQSAESGVPTEAPKAAAAELPEDELVVGVDPAGIGNAEHALVGSAVARHSMGLNENASTLLQAIAGGGAAGRAGYRPGAGSRSTRRRRSAHPGSTRSSASIAPVLDARVESAGDRAEALTARQRHAPAGLDPVDVLLVVDRHDAPRPPASARKL